MINVKLTTQHPQWPLKRQTPGSSGIWGDFRFHINEDIESCDVWIVLEGLLTPESTICSPDSTVLITWEPPTFRTYPRNFLKQFAHVISCHRNLHHYSVNHSQQAHPWFVNKSYDELLIQSPTIKSKLLSIISSNKAFTPEHARRLAFARALKDRLGDRAELYGRGINDFKDKWDVLAPYKYALAMENCSHQDWLTEKLPDCYLAYTFPFYWGAPNVEQYFDPSSFVAIDLHDFDGTLRRIERVLANPDHYGSALGSLRAARSHYLVRLQLFPMLAKWITTHNKPRTPARPITICPDTITPSRTGLGITNYVRMLYKQLTQHTRHR